MSANTSDKRSLLRRPLKWLVRSIALVGLLLLGPLAVMAFGDVDLQSHWSARNRDSSGQAPDPAKVTEAVVQVYGARTIGWRGAFGIHTWIATKRTGAADYTVHQVIGWRLYRGGSAVVITPGGAPDDRWYGAFPSLLSDRRGAGVEAMIDRIEAAVAAYPYADRYRAWPGPNSNTFTAFVARAVPELGLDLPPTAIGKDWLGDTRVLARLPSGTGWQVSFYGLLGLAIGLEEGIEANVLGLSAGLDVNDLALRLPGFGRVGPGVSHAAAAPAP